MEHPWDKDPFYYTLTHSLYQMQNIVTNILLVLYKKRDVCNCGDYKEFTLQLDIVFISLYEEYKARRLHLNQ